MFWHQSFGPFSCGFLIFLRSYIFRTTFSAKQLYCNHRLPLVQQLNKGQGLPTDCWPQVPLSADGLRVTSVQNVESSSRCWLSRPGLSLQISSYPNSSRCWLGTLSHRSTSSKHHVLNRMITGPGHYRFTVHFTM